MKILYKYQIKALAKLAYEELVKDTPKGQKPSMTLEDVEHEITLFSINATVREGVVDYVKERAKGKV